LVGMIDGYDASLRRKQRPGFARSVDGDAAPQARRLLHRDGEIAYCSEELDGKSCAGYDMPHLAGVMACRVTPRGTRCRHCDEVMRIRLITAPDFVPDGLRTAIN